MAYTFHGTRDLVMAPGRSVQTFPSGLVRVERRYFCRKSDAARYRSVLAVGNLLPNDDGAPAIDGLYIFPEPQEQSRDDGFVEFRVTAYGRSNIFSLDGITRQSILSTYSFSQTTIDNRGTFGAVVTESNQIQKNSFNELFTSLGVLPASESPTALFVAPAISNPLVIPVDTGIPLKAGVVSSSTSAQSTTQETSIFLTRVSFESKTFGRWAEYTVIWAANAQVYERTQYPGIQ
jgi:hypothetical protein